MLKRLYLDNCFTHNKRTFTFERGLTGIIGKNESGKSLIVEMIRYALFGSKALRGKAEDYRKLHVELDFQIGERAFTVVRKGNRATLEGDGLQVSGTRPVNEAIINLLGYDLRVFDVANACNQGNVEALSNMSPAERKQMVDQTVGLTVLDEVIRFCGEEGNAKKREAASFERALVKPVKPEGEFPPSATIKEKLTLAEAELDEFNQLRGFLSSKPEKPERPEDCPVRETVAELLAHERERQAVDQQIQIWKQQLSKLQRPEYAREELQAMLDQHEAHTRWREKQRLLEQGHHQCPKCRHKWPIAADQLQEYENVEPVEKPVLSRGQISEQMARHENLARIEELEDLLAKTRPLPDRSDDLVRRRSYEAALAQYEAGLKAWKAYNKGLKKKEARFRELEGVPEKVGHLRQQLRDAQHFETLMSQYRRALEHYEANLKTHAEIKAEADSYFAAREAIRKLKVQVKSLLLPSLNRVASALLSQMTGGERWQVVVDDDFNIEIDGQPINTLSGSGKAVANLAIRIALGQILTNRVFSVFIADEVDAAMDSERAANTAQALRRLTDTVNQVVLVTHKSPETDHLIELTK